MTSVTSAMPRIKHRGARLYHAMLFMCPPAFRREFASEMAQDVDAALDELPLDVNRTARLAFWTQIGADLARTIARQWLRTGLPILLPCSAIGATAALSLAARMPGHHPLMVPVSAADRDLMTLILLTGVVLVVIVSTIFFTFWFSRPLLRRHRR
jgi:hypothetical protein